MRQVYIRSYYIATYFIMSDLYVDCYLGNTWLVNSKKMWYGKQNTLGAKTVAWPRKTMNKRGDMRVWPRTWDEKGKSNQKPYIYNQQIYVGYYSWIAKWVHINLKNYICKLNN